MNLFLLLTHSSSKQHSDDDVMEIVQTEGYSAYRQGAHYQTQVVQKQRVDRRKVGNVAEDDTSERVGDTNNRQ